MDHQTLLDRRHEAEPNSDLGALVRFTNEGWATWSPVAGRWHGQWGEAIVVLDSEGFTWVPGQSGRILTIPPDEDGMPELFEAIIAQQLENNGPTNT
jgi:hypothetical protein